VSSQQDLPVCLPFAWPPDACPSAAAGVTVAGSANVAASPQGVSDFHFMVVVVVVAVVLALVHPLPSRPASNFTARRTGCWVLYALRSHSLSLFLHSPAPTFFTFSSCSCSRFWFWVLPLLFWASAPAPARALGQREKVELETTVRSILSTTPAQPLVFNQPHV